MQAKIMLNKNNIKSNV